MANHSPARGFSLVEILLVVTISLVISAAIFGLLDVAQVRNRSEADFLHGVQHARLGVSQITADIHGAGFPYPYLFASTSADPSAAPASLQSLFSVGFVGLPSQSCAIGSTCTLPTGFDLLLETNPDPLSATGVQWIEYRLVRPVGSPTGTLNRSAIQKAPGTDPIATAKLVPFVVNVLNDPTNSSDAIFNYVCSGTPCTPKNLQQVQINLRVRSFGPDLKTGQYRVISLSGLAQRMNPTF